MTLAVRESKMQPANDVTQLPIMSCTSAPLPTDSDPLKPTAPLPAGGDGGAGTNQLSEYDWLPVFTQQLSSAL